MEIINRYLVDALWSNHISTLKQQANKNYGLEQRAVWKRMAEVTTVDCPYRLYRISHARKLYALG